jgi:hypothetical protein
LGRGFALRRLCPSRPSHPATFHAGFHKTPKPDSCGPNSVCAPKKPGTLSGDDGIMHGTPAKTSSISWMSHTDK